MIDEVVQQLGIHVEDCPTFEKQQTQACPLLNLKVFYDALTYDPSQAKRERR